MRQGIMHAALGAVQSRARRSPAVYQAAMHMLPAGDAAKAPPQRPWAVAAATALCLPPLTLTVRSPARVCSRQA